ncbi:RrF2 family transcriptional regulator [Acidobacteriota bacterium]
MIKLSTKGRYGSRLMLNLASHYVDGKEPVILKRISEEEDISIRYLEQIIISLKIRKLVKSIRGASGGYILSKHPSEINLKEIIEAAEGPICLVDCVDDNDFCYRIPNCATYEIWKTASLMLENCFEKISLQDLVKILNKKKRKDKL